jgi:hypothetical protein
MTVPARNLDRISDHLSGWLARNEQGDPITRAAECECGRVFQQSLLNPAFVGANPRVAKEFLKQIPHGYVPIFCPACESKDLGRARTHFP